ncbi:hypothetical protein KI387_017127 [Taxus chinensis]|uniref:CAF1B/HIR1 beta-propeller domain-containing protein n=1 Tax=Taxus chinensis TaxID=29808 RepID=A0AA38LF25_TAXCH|nr:hypothetical protein KI387_017127 [Taxus chinensis]
MKGGTVQITWHDSKPVLTLDFHRLTGFLATGGADHDIKFWSLHQTEGKKEVPKASYESSLAYHSSAVNVLRFSPSGEQLASGADGGLQQILDTHLHYVQGVAWDPMGVYVASTSSDRTCRIYVNKPQNGRARGQERMNYVCQHVIAKSESEKQGTTKLHLFHDETLPSFFRRLQWSPDGSFLVVPAGIHKFLPDSSASNTAYVFSRKDFSRPALQLPGASKPIVAVRFCPLVFSLNAANSDALFKLPYRVVFAIATLNSLYIYDTESSPPIAIFAGLHYAAVTDVAWSSDARFLAVSSQDGYCTLVEFEDGELGSPATLSEIPSHVASYLPQATVKVANFAQDKMDVDMLVGDEKAMRKDLNMEMEGGVNAVQSKGPEKCEASMKKEDNSVLVACSNGSLSNGKEFTCGQKKQEDMQPVANLPKTSKRHITPMAVEVDNNGMEKMDVDISLADKNIMSKDLKMEKEEAAKTEQSTGLEKYKVIIEKAENSVLVDTSNSSLSNGKESTCDQKKQEDMQPIANLPKPSRRRIIPIAVEKP